MHTYITESISDALEICISSCANMDIIAVLVNILNLKFQTKVNL